MNDPTSSPIGEEDTRKLINTMLNAQDTALEYVIAPLIKHAEMQIAEQEKALQGIVKVLVSHAQKQIAKQAKLLDKVVDQLTSHARTQVATQNAQIVALEGSDSGITGGASIDFLSECSSGNPLDWCVVVYRHPDGRLCWFAFQCAYTPDMSGIEIIDGRCGWDAQNGYVLARNWVLSNYPQHFSCELEPPAGEPPPPPEPPPIPEPISQIPIVDIGPPPEPPPEPPPPPPRPPYQPIEPPPIDYVPPPPSDPNCPPVDPCYPRGLELVERETYSASPDFRPAPYWVRARCVDRCSAVIECYRGDCPPAYTEGWAVYGPYNDCLSSYEKELIVRECLGDSGGNQPPQPPGSEIPIPEHVNRPPINRPPPDDPDDPEECPKPKPIRPELRINEYVPVCTTYEQWTGKLTSELSGFASLEDVGLWLTERMDFDAPMPDFLTR